MGNRLPTPIRRQMSRGYRSPTSIGRKMSRDTVYLHPLLGNCHGTTVTHTHWSANVTGHWLPTPIGRQSHGTPVTHYHWSAKSRDSGGHWLPTPIGRKMSRVGTPVIHNHWSVNVNKSDRLKFLWRDLYKIFVYMFVYMLRQKLSCCLYKRCIVGFWDHGLKKLT